jgi:hypothetical protein
VEGNVTREPEILSAIGLEGRFDLQFGDPGNRGSAEPWLAKILSAFSPGVFL